jgi:hypothetical protein
MEAQQTAVKEKTKAELGRTSISVSRSVMEKAALFVVINKLTHQELADRAITAYMGDPKLLAASASNILNPRKP